MTGPLPPGVIRDAFVEACHAELNALKPGNVHIHAAGHGMEVRQYEVSAEAAAPFIADPSLRAGERIRRAVEASFAAAGCNTNLGILLLCAPLAAAADMTASNWKTPSPQPSPRRGEGVSPEAADGASPRRGEAATRSGAGEGASPTANIREEELHGRLSLVLSALDTQDAAEAFAAIALARPAGLGTVESQDVSRPPTVTLKTAMALASGRDRIARAYVTNFEDVFRLGLPALRNARQHALSSDLAITTLHMTYLATFEDSHIVRKHGRAAASEVKRAAEVHRPLWHPAATEASFAALLGFDRVLKARGLNPGTTADLVVATLFAEALTDRLRSPPSRA